jgi:hypothetical protein
MPNAQSPSGLLTLPLVRLRQMVAECESFLAWTGAATSELAKDHIHLLQSTRNPALPLCLIDYGDGFDRERIGVSMNRPFEQRGTLIAFLRDQVDPALDEAEATIAFCNRLGALWQDLERMIVTEGRLLITSIGLAANPARITSDRRPHTGDLFEAALSISWRSTH